MDVCHLTKASIVNNPPPTRQSCTNNSTECDTTRRLQNKVAVITGAGKGIGKATAQLFAQQGATVAAIDIDQDSLRDTLDAINVNSQCCSMPCDIANSQHVDQVITEVHNLYGKIDILVNVAGIPGGFQPVASLEDSTWQRMMNINLTGTFFCTRAVIQQMLETGTRGSIISVSSTGALSGESSVHYDTAKGALLSMTRSLAKELGGNGIRVNAICPGPTNTDLLSALGEKQIQSLARRIPLKRIGEPEDIASTALFLASDESAFITGQTIMVNGGSWFL